MPAVQCRTETRTIAVHVQVAGTLREEVLTWRRVAWKMAWTKTAQLAPSWAWRSGTYASTDTCDALSGVAGMVGGP